jgi:[glutamine synthetase] adenylyltransferase / [glutamine synthetase]-adenylyl-L-tyrosine phosphorylase
MEIMVGTEPRQTDPPSTEEGLYISIGTLVADAGLSPPLVLKRLKSDVRKTPHSRRALTNFHRFLMTGFPSAWLRDFEEHRHLQQILLELFSQSQFLADILVRNPELFRWVTSTNVLQIAKTEVHYRAEVAEASGLFQRLEKKLGSLKRFQRRELLRIGARQILGKADVATTSAELSALADSVIEAVLDFAYEHIFESTQIPPRRDLAVIGLGKLGGGELNFSSDIDLMFVYENDGALEGSAPRVSTLHEYYVRVGEFVVRRLSEQTAEGHFYRVDMRLRPDGSSGPLAMSRSAYFAYYEARGEPWERQMLIKARVVAGNKNVGEEWLKDLQPFVFPKTLLTSPLDEIARIKTKIEAKIKDVANIKLGIGGIRDIEFSVQALQLLNGGANAGIRQSGSLPAVRTLVASGHLKESEGKDLESAYIFLRTVEDRLQLLHGLQEHSLPESVEERTILARQLGYRSAVAFSLDLEKHQSKVRSVYRSIFGGTKLGKRGSPASSVESLVEIRRLKMYGFSETSIARKRILEIMSLLPELRQPDLLRSLLGMIRRHGAPDWCLENLQMVAASIPIRRSLQQVLSNERALELLTLLCSRSSRLAGVLAREPLLFESMVGRPEDLLSPQRGWEFLKHSDLVRYRTYNDFKAIARYIVGETGVREFTSELSNLAEEIMMECYDESVRETPDAGGISLMLLALGKLGGGEISFGSDLDVILLYKEEVGTSQARTAVAVGRRLREKLSGVYEIDFRLRPEGRISPLATEYEYYRQYLADRASFWERQSLIKARSIAGDKTLAADVSQFLREFIFDAPLPKTWKRDIFDMRQKMVQEHERKDKNVNLKAGKGGLADLEFLVQSVQLRNGRAHPHIVQTNTFIACTEIGRAHLLNKRDFKKVDQNLEFFRRLESYIRMNSESTDFMLPRDNTRQLAIVAAMGAPSPAALRRGIDKKRRENHTIFTNVLRTRLA